jgi:hypothetical protein
VKIRIVALKIKRGFECLTALGSKPVSAEFKLGTYGTATPNSHISIVSSCFSCFAYQFLYNRLSSFSQ